MEYIWWLYLATRLDAVKGALGGFTVAGFVIAAACMALVGIFTIIIHSGYSEKEQENDAIKYNPYRKKLFRGAIVAVVIGFLCASLNALVPSKKDAIFIAGGVGVIEASKAVAGSEIAKKSVEVIEAWLAKELEDLKKQAPDAANKVKDKVKETVKETVKDAVK